MASPIKIKDKSVYDYLQILNAMGQADPKNAAGYLQQAMGVYASYLDSQNPQKKLESLYGAESAPVISRSGLDVNTITDEKYLDYTQPLVSKFLEARQKYVGGTATEEEVKRMNALKKLLDNPSAIEKYQQYKPTKKDKQSLIDQSFSRSLAQKASEKVSPGMSSIYSAVANPSSIPSTLGKMGLSGLLSYFATPSDEETRNSAFSSTLGTDLGNINPLQ